MDGRLGVRPALLGIIASSTRRDSASPAWPITTIATPTPASTDAGITSQSPVASKIPMTPIHPPSGSRARVGSAQNDRVVSPGVGQAERRQMTLVDKSVGGHDFDAGDSKISQMSDGFWMSEACESSARILWDSWIEPREAAQIQFVKNRLRLRDALSAWLRRFLRDDDRFWGEGAAIDPPLEHRGMELVGSIDPRRMGIGEQFGEVESMAALGLERPVGAQAVAIALAQAFDRSVKDIAGSRRQSDARGLAIARIEQAEIHRAGIRRKDRNVDAVGRERDAKGLRSARAGLHAGAAAATRLALAISW